MPKPNNWLHIASRNGPTILNTISGKMNNSGINISDKMAECALNLSDRLMIILIALKKLTDWENNIYSEIRPFSTDQKYIFDPKKKGCAIKLKPDIKYNFLLYLDSCIFELNSACDLIKIYFDEIHQLTGNSLSVNKSTGQHIHEILQSHNHDDTWFKLLDSIRNHFIHESCPYFAIDISTDTKDILIMKKNLHDFEDEDNYYRLSEIIKLFHDFDEYWSIISAYLIKLIVLVRK